MMGEGVLKPFDSDWLFTHKKCFVCYTMQFPYLKEPVYKEAMLFYMQSKGKKGMTYYDYLKYGDEKVIDNPIIDIVMNKRIYAVIYTNPKEWALGNYLGCILSTTGEAAAAGAVGGAVVAGVPTGGGLALIGASFGGTGGAIAGAAYSTLKCTNDWIQRWANNADNDMVYVVDLNRNKADTGEKLEMGCEGGLFTEVQTA